MKITYLITRFDSIGGAQIHVRDLALSMLNQGHEVVVLSGTGGSLLQDLVAEGGHCHEVVWLSRNINPVRDVLAGIELYFLLRRIRPDLLSIHSSKAGVIGRIASWLARVPSVFTAHGWAFTEGVGALESAVYRIIERLVAPLTRKVITVSEFDRRLAVNHSIVSAEKVVAIHNAMPDISALQMAAPERSPVRLVMVARFQRQKDHVTLLEALAGLTNEDWELELVGDGPEMNNIRQVVRRLRLSGRVAFLGARTDVVDVISLSQVFLLISYWEGFPLTILEAMRAGLPVIASDVGGVSEAIDDGVNGYLVPKSNVEILRARIKRLLLDPDLRKSMGVAGRVSYESNFRFERMLSETCSVYEEVAGNKLVSMRKN